MPCPPMTTNKGMIEEDIPEHIKRIQAKALGEENERQEIDWEFWHFMAVFVFRFTEDNFFNNTTLRRLYSLATQHEKYHNKQNGGGN